MPWPHFVSKISQPTIPTRNSSHHLSTSSPSFQKRTLQLQASRNQHPPVIPDLNLPGGPLYPPTPQDLDFYMIVPSEALKDAVAMEDTLLKPYKHLPTLAIRDEKEAGLNTASMLNMAMDSAADDPSTPPTRSETPPEGSGKTAFSGQRCHDQHTNFFVVVLSTPKEATGPTKRLINQTLKRRSDRITPSNQKYFDADSQSSEAQTSRPTSKADTPMRENMSPRSGTSGSDMSSITTTIAEYITMNPASVRNRGFSEGDIITFVLEERSLAARSDGNVGRDAGPATVVSQLATDPMPNNDLDGPLVIAYGAPDLEDCPGCPAPTPIAGVPLALPMDASKVPLDTLTVPIDAPGLPLNVPKGPSDVSQTLDAIIAQLDGLPKLPSDIPKALPIDATGQLPAPVGSAVNLAKRRRSIKIAQKVIRKSRRVVLNKVTLSVVIGRQLAPPTAVALKLISQGAPIEIGDLAKPLPVQAPVPLPV